MSTSPFTSLYAAVCDAAVRQAFVDWFTAKNFVGEPLIILDGKLTESLWRAFTQSPQAKALSIALPKYDSSLKKNPPASSAPGVGSVIVASQAISKPTPAHLAAAAPATAPDVAPVPVKAVKPVVVLPEVPDAAPAPAPAPAAGTGQSGLVALLAQELQAYGFTPQQAITAQQVESIAFEQAQSVVEMVIDDMLTSGKLASVAPTPAVQTVEIRVNGVLSGKPLQGMVPKFFPRLRKLVECRIPSLLVGPAGCGKTTAVEMLAEHLGLPFHRISLSAGVDEGCLQGWLLPVEAQGTFAYVPSPVVRAYTEGGVVLLDELDAADANMLIMLSAVLDNSSWHIPLRYQDTALVRHHDFIPIASANTFGHGASRQFVGAQQLDERTLSRFRMGQICCDYDPELERALYAESVVEIGHRLRARCRTQAEFAHDVSTRDIAGAHQKLQCFTPEEAWYDFFADWPADDIERVHAILDHDAGSVVLA